ncbi:MAG: ABC transporter ATP-binding protein [Halanaerobiales bacterium]|nr:ABC transporter ATP-binding protein [Halanaerobiales bacterium]
MQNLLEIKNLDLTLDKEQILKNINLSISGGEVFAVIGPNGCGKSSLAYTLMGLKGYKTKNGSIIYKGEEISNLSVTDRAKRGITLAWQEPARFEGVTVKEFLSLGAKARNIDITEEDIKWALNEVAIVPKKYLNRKVDETLSGGERKRIEIASILLMKPDLVILDEPDSGVDVVALNNIRTVIEDFRKENIGVLLITHSDEMLDVADKAALICHGEVFNVGDPKQVSEYFKFECTPCEDENPEEHQEVLFNE